MAIQKTNSPPTILQPVDEALRSAHKYFMHTLNLTRRKAADSSPTNSLRCPTTEEVNELKSGVERFGSYLHAKATAELEEAMRLQDIACDQLTIAHDLYEQLMRGCQLHSKDASFNPWNAEWKQRERLPYTLCYMKTRQHDTKIGGLPMPLRRTQEQWEDIFRTNTKHKTQARATEASWCAAIEDATTEATEACANLREASRLLREAARTETVDRHSMLKEVSNKWCDIFTEHITVQDVFEFHRGTLVAGPGCYAEEIEEGHSPRDIVTQYDSILRMTIPECLSKLDTSLKTWSREEMEPRGKKIVSLATDFDYKLQRIERTFHGMQLDLSEVRQFLREQTAAAAHPSALPNAFVPMVPDTPTQTSVEKTVLLDSKN